MQQITLRLPEETLEKVEIEAEERGVSRSEHIRRSSRRAHPAKNTSDYNPNTTHYKPNTTNYSENTSGSESRPRLAPTTSAGNSVRRTPEMTTSTSSSAPSKPIAHSPNGKREPAHSPA